MSKKGRISMTTADGKFIFTPERKKGKYCVVRIYANDLKLDNHLPLKDNTKNLNPLPSCHSEGNYLKDYQQQYTYALNRLNEIYNSLPDAFIRFDKEKKKYIINTKKLSALVYDNKARSKSRNEIVMMPKREKVVGKEIDNYQWSENIELSLRETKYINVDLIEVEKEKIKQAEKINNYFGIENTTENLIKEIKTRNKIIAAKEEYEKRTKKYGDYALITDKDKIKEILSEGDFNQNDLYLFCAALTSTKKNADEFSSILHRFREYNLRNNTTLLINKNLTPDGIEKFIIFFVENGVVDSSTQGMTPFNYRTKKYAERYVSGSKRKNPTDETWRKFFVYLKSLLNLLSDDKTLKGKGWEDDGRLREKQIAKLCDSEEYNIKYTVLSKNTRQNYHLTKDEFDKIFKLKLKSSTEERKHSTKGHTYTVGYSKEDLELTRDMFVMMCWGGGLRPIEYIPDKCHVLKDSKGAYYLNYVSSEKNLKEISNPIINYSLDVIKKYKYQLPYQKLKSLNFKHRLKEILKQAKINRDIIKIESRGGKSTRTVVNIQDAVYPYFARHTFVQVLSDEGLSTDQIARFTGHGVPNLSIEAYSSKGLALKRKLIEKIKAG